jgi:WD40 repeat protein
MTIPMRSRRFPTKLGYLVGSLVSCGVLPVGLLKAEELPAKVTFDEHIKPIFREHCTSCHNANEKKSGLSLDNFASTMEGGSGGESLVAGDLESSRLWALTAHIEQPKMPPNQDRIPDAKLGLLQRWIEQGMPENNGSAIMAPKVDLSQMGEVKLTRPEGPLPMPEGMLKQTPLFTPRAASISALAASPWSPLIAIGGQEQVSLYHSQSGELLGVLPFPEGEPQSITFSRDGKLVLVGGGRHSHSGFAVLYEVKTGKRITRVGDELDIVMSADINDDNSLIALAGPQKLVRVYDTASGNLVHELKKHTDWIYAVRFSPDGILLASADRSNGLVVWEAESGKLYSDLLGHKGEIRSLVWRPDSQALFSGSLDGSIKLWDMNASKLIKSWDAHGGGVLGLAISNDGTLVSTGQDRKVKLWDASGKALGEMPSMVEAGLEVAITADAKEVAAGDWAGNVRRWVRENPKDEKVLAANPATLQQVRDARQRTLLENRDQHRLAVASHQTALADLAKLESKLKQAEQAVAKIQAELQKTEMSRKQAQQVAGQAQENLEKAVAALEQQQQKLQALINRQAVQLARSQSTDEVAAEIQKINAGLAELEVSVRGLRQKSMEQQALVAVEQDKLDELQKQLASAKQQPPALKTALAAENEKVAVAAAKVDSALASLQAAEARLASAESDLAAFDSARNQWQQRQLELQQRQVAIAQSQTAIESAMTAASKDKEMIVAKVEALKKELEKLQQSLQQIDAQRQQAEQLLSAKQAELDRLGAEVATSKLEQDSLDLLLKAYQPAP